MIRGLQASLLCVLLLLAAFIFCSGCSGHTQNESATIANASETTAYPSDSLPTTVYYQNKPAVSLYLDKIAVTNETMNQIVEKEGWEELILNERSCLLTERQHDFFEIRLNEEIDLDRSCTIWCLYRPYSMYTFNNVFLSPGCMLCLRQSDDEADVFLTVEQENGMTRDYLAVLAFIG